MGMARYIVGSDEPVVINPTPTDIAASGWDMIIDPITDVLYIVTRTESTSTKRLTSIDITTSPGQFVTIQSYSGSPLNLTVLPNQIGIPQADLLYFCSSGNIYFMDISDPSDMQYIGGFTAYAAIMTPSIGTERVQNNGAGLIAGHDMESDGATGQAEFGIKTTSNLPTSFDNVGTLQITTDSDVLRSVWDYPNDIYYRGDVAATSSTSLQVRLESIDTSNPASPTKVGDTLVTGISVPSVSGLNSSQMYKRGDYLYVHAQRTGMGYIFIWNVSNPSSPSYVGVLSHADLIVTVFGGRGTISGAILYLPVQNGVIMISLVDPVNPAIVGYATTEVNERVCKRYGSYLYCASQASIVSATGSLRAYQVLSEAT